MEKLVCITWSETYIFHISLWVCVCVKERDAAHYHWKKKIPGWLLLWIFSMLTSQLLCVCGMRRKNWGFWAGIFPIFLYSVGYCLCVNDDNDDNDNYDDYFLVLISSIRPPSPSPPHLPSPTPTAVFLFLILDFAFSRVSFEKNIRSHNYS